MPELAANHGAENVLRLLLAASLVVPLGLIVGASWFDYHSVFEDARRDLSHVSEVAREHAAKVFESEAQIADRVNDLVATLDPETVAGSEKTYHDLFAGIIARLPQAESVLLADSTGRPLASGVAYPVPKTVTVQGRDYFKGAIASPGSNFVSTLQTGEINRQPFFGLSRTWTGADGSVKGVIDVAVSPAFFRDFYTVLVNEEGDGPDGKVITLIRDDGEFLTRYPPLPAVQAPAARSIPFFAALRANPNEGTYESASVVEGGGPRRVFAYRKVQGFPVYVVAGRNRSDLLAAWRQKAVVHLMFGLPATLALFAMTWAALVRARREQDALARANQEIARREKAEAALLRSQRLEAVGQMTGGVAHDFNNLLTVILGSAETLSKRADDPARVRRLAGQIVMAARHGGVVTQQLLTFSRRQFLHAETADVNRLLRDFRQLLDRAASQAVRIELVLDEAVGPVKLDLGHFEAAILNLVGNGRDAMPDGGCIVITTQTVLLPGQAEMPSGEYVRIAVTDQGTGMDAQTAAKAFEPFFTTKEIGRGTGLGLSQVYGFAKQAGGDVRIVTAPGQGTTVELLLPRTYEASPARPEAAAATGAKPGEVVLVVEDQPQVLATVVETLESLGYCTVTATSGAAALDRLRERRRLDVLFSDVVMPGGLNGAQLAIEARQLQRGIKVLLTSGYAPGLDSRTDGTIPVLMKPYDRAGLAAHLRAVLDSLAPDATGQVGHVEPTQPGPP